MLTAQSWQTSAHREFVENRIFFFPRTIRNGLHDFPLFELPVIECSDFFLNVLEIKTLT
ncbi:uncharacterized protein LACBIDRAFT_304766 [Laccaria bicolor S238N-H82]|uniref:Predicted protein n=1 Tax=Laccaria bicolor (strain S238N-H82 / ATCC MYA-4686) TaxID=486041 RepID=B0DMA4_LACBS|nr:uncharacterized protein LACBIDRAFT_304766 [Laccaria bicolor S238N-H82]EDR04246.1 predicted protein [Laccaria bicolor S238N-H82]|eukprot:XP_001885137.1 predicted protein [Laccaria bicolor S238N-H82]